MEKVQTLPGGGSETASACWGLPSLSQKISSHVTKLWFCGANCQNKWFKRSIFQCASLLDGKSISLYFVTSQEKQFTAILTEEEKKGKKG